MCEKHFLRVYFKDSDISQITGVPRLCATSWNSFALIKCENVPDIDEKPNFLQGRELQRRSLASPASDGDFGGWMTSGAAIVNRLNWVNCRVWKEFVFATTKKAEQRFIFVRGRRSYLRRFSLKELFRSFSVKPSRRQWCNYCTTTYW